MENIYDTIISRERKPRTMTSLATNTTQFSESAAEDNDDARSIVIPSPPSSSPLSIFDMHHYQPSPLLTDDENYMDIVMIITRSLHLRQGSMGCLLVRPRSTTSSASIMQNQGYDGERLPSAAAAAAAAEEEGERYNEANNGSKSNEPASCDDHDDDNDNNHNNNMEFSFNLLNRIIAATTNASLFTPRDSDVHAEINAIGQVARRQTAMNSTTRGATAYITMPPCKKCFGALYASGISRIVSRRSHPMILHNAASKVGIRLVTLTQDQLDSQKVRLDQLFSHNRHFGGRDENKELVLSKALASNVGSGCAAKKVVDDKEGCMDMRVKSNRGQSSEEFDEERDSKIAKLNTANSN